MKPLSSLPIGSRWSAPDIGITGTLLRLSPCAATVRLDGGSRHVEIVTADGDTRAFEASVSHTTTWSRETGVIPEAANG